jgi:hypothetical protein
MEPALHSDISHLMQGTVLPFYQKAGTDTPFRRRNAFTRISAVWTDEGLIVLNFFLIISNDS